MKIFFRCISTSDTPKSRKLTCFSSRIAVAFMHSIEARCSVKNEDVVGAEPTGNASTTSEGSPGLLPTKVRIVGGLVVYIATEPHKAETWAVVHIIVILNIKLSPSWYHRTVLMTSQLYLRQLLSRCLKLCWLHQWHHIGFLVPGNQLAMQYQSIC